MFATIFYIMWRMCYSTCLEDGLEEADMYKALTDFISYSSINLTWFAFNFVCVTMPPLCIYMLN